MSSGLGVSPGIAMAKAFRFSGRQRLEYDQTAQSVADELELLQAAHQRIVDETQRLYDKTFASMGEEQAAIFIAHRMILEDPELMDALTSAIKQEMLSAAYAVERTMKQYVELFETMDDEYMRERAADMRDIQQRLVNAVLGNQASDLGSLPGRVIVVAQDLTPSDTASMDYANVAGILTQAGGRTSHVAIMARALEIPTVTGASEAVEEIQDGDFLIIDGESGQIFVNPSEQTIAQYTQKQAALQQAKELLSVYKDRETVTADGMKIELAANIGTPQELAAVCDKGADGIGLFRSEFLFMDKPTLPTEEEQYQAYQKVVQKMGGRRVIVRTLDVGGDKQLPAIDIPQEENPFLGYRAIRLCLDRVDLFKIQLRALLRAGTEGNLHIMLPMISCIEEIHKAKAIVEEVKRELTSQGVRFAHNVPLGIMIEIPAAAILANELAKEVDFFSIGTNDLIQYTTATDRGNKKVAHLYSMYHPAVLRLISMSAKAARDNGIFCGMCGEAAAEEKLAPIWIGLGLDELSVNPASILRMRRTIGILDAQRCRAIAAQAIALSSAEEVETMLAEVTKT